jgi:hypothetical protein
MSAFTQVRLGVPNIDQSLAGGERGGHQANQAGMDRAVQF